MINIINASPCPIEVESKFYMGPLDIAEVSIATILGPERADCPEILHGCIATIFFAEIHLKKISNFHVFCTQTYMQNADFGQILCRRGSTKCHLTS